MKTTSKRTGVHRWSIIALFAGSIALVQDAVAAEKPSCIANRVDTDGNRIALWCNNDANIYYVFRTGTNSVCATASIDTMRLWLSQIQAALLSGKQLDFFYNNPVSGGCPNRAITSVGLKL